MAITTRQSNLLVQQDWTRIYQTFRDADFQSYDYETLRKSMIDYLRKYYPEDFNDFTESSEYIALIDLIAFLGQSLAFRTDLNSRENFIDTAERRDSVLKLARLISYNPKRNIPATGYLKINAVSTSENIFDSNGLNLANILVSWNDSTNENWLEQFTTIINATLVDSQVVGKPGASKLINGIQTDEYSVSLSNTSTSVIPFSAKVENTGMQFEAVSATSATKEYIYEVDPVTKTVFTLLNRNDNQGNGANNTGFFLYIKQGQLSSIDFSVPEKLPNRVVNINVTDINNTDVWLYALGPNGEYTSKWKQIPAVNGVNVIYNQTSDRNLFQVNTRTNDQIDLVFGDGSFSNIPQGNYRLFYRQSNGLSYKITPDEMQNVNLTMNYVSRAGRVETFNISASLKYTIANSSPKESVDEIRAKAPQQYYTQNRMVTGEDYNILPYTTFSNVLKVKSVNRISSGISRYLDVVDTSGKYSSTNIFAQDGVLYRNETTKSTTFTFSSTAEVQHIVQNIAQPMVQNKEVMHLYYRSAPKFTTNTAANFTLTYSQIGATTGFFTDGVGAVMSVGPGASGNFNYIQTGALVRFVPPAGQHFNKDNQLVPGPVTVPTDKMYIYGAVSNYTTTSATFSATIPTGAIVGAVTPVFNTIWPQVLYADIANAIVAKRNFGIRYDATSMTWAIIDATNLNPGEFDPTTAGTASDSSWILKFNYFSGQYSIAQRSLEYFIESVMETRFYFDPKVKVYDSSTGTVVRDHVKILKANSQPNSNSPLEFDQFWYIYDIVTQVDGYQDTHKILITFPDANEDGIPDDPTLFDVLVDPSTNPVDKKVFFKQVVDYDKFVKYVVVDRNTINTTYATKSQIALAAGSYPTGQVFYAYTENKFYVYTGLAITYVTGYSASVGRQDLYFQYRHNSTSNRRIDPSPVNLMDMYILTKEYATNYANWVKDTSGKVAKPVPPTTEELRIEFSQLESMKTVSDTLIYTPATFKPIFGSKAESVLRATFKVVKNTNSNISDNEVKSRVIAAINKYFDINNWDFGETFYFSELSAYLHTELVPNISSIIIVPSDNAIAFGGLYQINAEANEIVISAATVDNVEIITAITAANINNSYVV